MDIFVLIFGLFFPTISWLSFITISVKKSSASGVYIPFVGPVLIDIWLASVGAPNGYLFIPWILDIGTIFFLIALPAMVKEAFNTSRFTRLFVLTGDQSNQAVSISFHKGDNYHFQKKWQRPPGETGLIEINEPGTYTEQSGSIKLTSHTGSMRSIVKRKDVYFVQDDDSSDDYRIDGWILRVP